MPWLTYQQIGERFGMNAEAARGRVRRLGWRTQLGNDGRAMALVPDDIELRPGGGRADGPGGVQLDDRTDGEWLFEQLADAEARVSRADGRADAAGVRADAALALADRLGAQLADASARVERAEKRVEEVLAGQLLMAETHARELAEAHADAQAARQRAEALSDRAENLTRELAASEAAAVEQHARADDLRLMLDAMNENLMSKSDEASVLQEQLEQARAVAQTAEDLRRADEARKGQGRWARLRAAWRGE